VERFLARGGMGAVFVGQHVGTEQRVAIKVLWPQVLSSSDAVAKFELEAKVAARVRSEHIVHVLDAGFDDETDMPFLVMELLDGATLEARVRERGSLPPREVVEVMRQVALALDKAHGNVDATGAARPIVHRDLKPENLFLTAREDGTPLVKILDFGIAKVLSETSKTTQQGRGTPLFMSNEQIAAKAVTPQTDVWALGLIAFFLLTGAPYWRAGSLAEATLVSLFAEILTEPLEAASRRAAELGSPIALPAGFDAWFARCVNRDPTARFSSAGQAASALAAALGVAPSSSSVRPPASDGRTVPLPPLPAPVAKGAPPAASASRPPAGELTRLGTASHASLSHTAAAAPAARASEAPAKGRRSPWLGVGLGAAALVSLGLLALRLAPGALAPSAVAVQEPRLPATAGSSVALPHATPPPGTSTPAPASPPDAPSVSAAPAARSAETERVAPARSVKPRGGPSADPPAAPPQPTPARKNDDPYTSR
jgi:serine/threonine-protein kinase